MLSAKAVVNFTLLAIIVPRVIRKSMSTRTVQGSEIRLNYIGAEASILVSVIGVLCVAIAFKFWMLLGALIIYALASADDINMIDPSPVSLSVHFRNLQQPE